MAVGKSPLFSVLRGSVAGLTFLSGPSNQIVVRQRTTPVNPQTTRQTQIRSAVSDASALYAALSAANKTLWSDYASSLTYQGPLGPYQITGRQACVANVSLARYLFNRGLGITLVGADPPLVPGFLTIATPVIGVLPAPGTGFSLTLSNSSVDAAIIAAELSRPFPPARNRFQGAFLSETLQGADVNAGASVVLSFTGLQAGLAYFVRFRIISKVAPHRISQPMIMRAVASTVAP